MANTFELIKKSKPKIATGDIFGYKIDNSFYAGIVLSTQLDPTIRFGVMLTCVFLETKYDTLNEISIHKTREDLVERKLLFPPTNTNKRGWTHGYFVKLDNICLEFAESMLEEIRFFHGVKTIYNLNYLNAANCPDFKLCGETGLISHEEIELLLQISLDLQFYAEIPSWFDPYEYYRELKEAGFSGEYPFWYLKAKERLKNVDSSKNLI